MRAQFDNDDLALFPQQFVNAQLLIDTLKDVVIAPSAAIQRGAPGAFVFLIKSNNTVAVTKVKLGPVQGERVAVLTTDNYLPQTQALLEQSGARVSEVQRMSLEEIFVACVMRSRQQVAS